MLQPIKHKRGAGLLLFEAIRLGLGLIFIYAGGVKLLDIQSFGVIIARYGLLPEPLLLPAAVGLPTLEVLAGLGLLFRVRGSQSLVTGMLALFAAVLWFGILRGLEVDCGCFSAGELTQHAGLRQAFHRDLAMLAASAYLFIWPRFFGPSSSRGARIGKPASHTSNKELAA